VKAIPTAELPALPPPLALPGAAPAAPAAPAVPAEPGGGMLSLVTAGLAAHGPRLVPATKLGAK
jgi:hypothetical protein